MSTAAAPVPGRFWEPGTVIEWVYQGTGRHEDKPNVRPMTVVRDDEDGLVAWLAPGTPLIKPVLTDGRETRYAGPVAMFTEERVLKLDVWRGTGILKVLPPGRPWSVWHFWADDGAFRGWYVNLETPHVRDVAGRRTSTVDHVLDLWIQPDRTIEWKDEDELEGAVTAGRFTSAEAAAIIADAQAAVREIEAWQSPFSDGWESWVPPDNWRLPTAPTTHQPTLIAEELHS